MSLINICALNGILNEFNSIPTELGLSNVVHFNIQWRNKKK